MSTEVKTKKDEVPPTEEVKSSPSEAPATVEEGEIPDNDDLTEENLEEHIKSERTEEDWLEVIKSDNFCIVDLPEKLINDRCFMQKVYPLFLTDLEKNGLPWDIPEVFCNMDFYLLIAAKFALHFGDWFANISSTSSVFKKNEVENFLFQIVRTRHYATKTLIDGTELTLIETQMTDSHAKYPNKVRFASLTEEMLRMSDPEKYLFLDPSLFCFEENAVKQWKTQFPQLAAILQGKMEDYYVNRAALGFIQYRDLPMSLKTMSVMQRANEDPIQTSHRTDFAETFANVLKTAGEKLIDEEVADMRDMNDWLFQNKKFVDALKTLQNQETHSGKRKKSVLKEKNGAARKSSRVEQLDD